MEPSVSSQSILTEEILLKNAVKRLGVACSPLRHRGIALTQQAEMMKVDDDEDEEEVKWGEKQNGSMANEEKGHTGAGRNEAEHILNTCTEKLKG